MAALAIDKLEPIGPITFVLVLPRALPLGTRKPIKCSILNDSVYSYRIEFSSIQVTASELNLF